MLRRMVIDVSRNNTTPITASAVSSQPWLVPPRSIRSCSSWMPCVTGSEYAATRSGVTNWSSGSTNPLKNTDASSTSIDSCTACRSESTMVEINKPSPSDENDSSTTTVATSPGALSSGTWSKPTTIKQISAATDRLKKA